MTTTKATLYEVSGEAAWITLNRPDNRNALSATWWTSCTSTWRALVRTITSAPSSLQEAEVPFVLERT